MLKSCKYCGRVHAVGAKCLMKPARRKYDYSDREVWRFRHSQLWTDKAVAIKERDHYLCQWCLKNNVLTYSKLEVHHITSLETDIELKLDDDNLITLCRSCHEAAEKNDIEAESLREIARENNAK